MPVSVPHFPSLGLGLLKPALEAIGARCDIRYFSLDYVDHIGAAAHACLTEVAYYMAHVGEWVFAGVAHGTPEASGLDFLTGCFARDHSRFNTLDRLAVFVAARRSAGSFIERCLNAIDWCDYDIVGFTSSFQQTMASLALARRIRQEQPHITIAFGGVNCLDDMGRALLENYDFIDAVCLGEGDRCFPELVRRLREGGRPDAVPGMAVRGGGAAAPEPIIDMDALPYPDYDDFFDQHARSKVASQHRPAVVFETARGCWWGERHNCTFCGLNGTTLRFRAKSAGRAYEELEYLVHRHGCRDVANADKILDQTYFENFLPRLAESGLDLTIYYEVKVGISPAQIDLLARAGVRKIQFGIETFDTGLLRSMAKGTTALQNIEVLKLAAEAGIYVEWLALSGFPGERPEQYERLARLLPKLFHLQPPAAFIRARADRFSPYQRDPARYGVELAPLPAYRHIFPFDAATVCRLANHFTLHSPALDDHDRYVAGAAAQYALWQARGRDSRLWYEGIDAEAIMIHDTRGGAAEQVITRHGAAAALLRRCWRITSWSDIVAELGVRYGVRALQEAADDLEACGVMAREGARCLTLALRQPGFRGAPSWAEIRARSAA